MSRKLELSRALGYPYEVQLVPTNACNIHCSQCPKTHFETDNRHLDADVYERVRDQLFPYVGMLNMQGLGEPTLSPLFWQMIDDAMAHDLQVRFVSNGTIMGESRVAKLVAAGVHLTISLDGATKETHEAARAGSRFDQLMTVLERIAAAVRERPGTGFTLHLNTVVTTNNVREIEAILDIAHRSGARQLSLINPGTGDRTDDFALAAIGRHRDDFAALREAIAARATRYGITLLMPSFLDDGAAVNGNGNGSAKHRGGADAVGGENGNGAAAREELGDLDRLFPGRCYDPWLTTYIDVDGWIRPCCRAIWIGMGNILEQDFKTIWNNEHFRTFRRTVNSNAPPKFCRNCNTNWGINRGDERRVEKLAARGVRLAPPPPVGVNYDHPLC